MQRSNALLRTADPDRATPEPAPLFAFSGGFWRDRRIRRILSLSGYDLRVGIPGPGDRIAVWGQRGTARRGAWIAQRTGASLLHVEDGFLRGLHPGRAGGAPIGLCLDPLGQHFDPAQPSRLEHILASDPLDDPRLLQRAGDLVARVQQEHLSKYCASDPELTPPPPGYVLLIDQTRGDASVAASGGTDRCFAAMLTIARAENPGTPIVIKTHPETAHGLRPGHFTPGDLHAGETICDAPISPWTLLNGATQVYVFSSQMGFEAILAGHRPKVFGQPFYSGWGLSVDQRPLPRRRRRLCTAQIAAAALIRYPVWFDPFRDRLCDVEQVVDTLSAQARAWRQDRLGWSISGASRWKRKHLCEIFGTGGPVRFAPARDVPHSRAANPARRMQWASKPVDAADWQVEDGFLRSRGLGAALIPPMSLVLDDLGIYFDPRTPSRLEQLIAARAHLNRAERQRAEALIAALRAAGLSKYNTGGALPDLPAGHRVLVPGQVADDASLRFGAGAVSDNMGLLRAVRAAKPDARVIYKPHPDVEAGLRGGAIAAQNLADVVLRGVDSASALDQVDEVWTMTSLLGFEALLRGLPVTVLGRPFYAGWGLTCDLDPTPLPRRNARPDLAGLVHAALIDYPRYFDPQTRQICPVEVVVERLGSGAAQTCNPLLGLMAALQRALPGR